MGDAIDHYLDEISDIDEEYYDEEEYMRIQFRELSRIIQLLLI